MARYRHQNGFQILHHGRIPKSQNLDSFCFQDCFSILVVFFLVRLCVFSAIKFYCQLRLVAIEINNKSAYWMLTLELDS